MMLNYKKSDKDTIHYIYKYISTVHNILKFPLEYLITLFNIQTLIYAYLYDPHNFLSVVILNLFYFPSCYIYIHEQLVFCKNHDSCKIFTRTLCLVNVNQIN